MVMIKGKGGYERDYPDDVLETVKINGKIKKDFTDFCKKKKIVKGKLIEEFYKVILLRFKEGSLNNSGGYCTINILREPIIKKSKNL